MIIPAQFSRKFFSFLWPIRLLDSTHKWDTSYRIRLTFPTSFHHFLPFIFFFFLNVFVLLLLFFIPFLFIPFLPCPSIPFLFRVRWSSAFQSSASVRNSMTFRHKSYIHVLWIKNCFQIFCFELVSTPSIQWRSQLNFEIIFFLAQFLAGTSCSSIIDFFFQAAMSET